MDDWLHKAGHSQDKSGDFVNASSEHASTDTPVGQGLPQFLCFLSALPGPDAVARALQLGPLAPLDFGSVGIVRVSGDTVEVLGTHGYTQEEINRYFRMPIGVSTPFTQAINHGEVLVDDIDELLDEFDALRMDADLWDKIMQRFGSGHVVSAPILVQGTVVGAFGGITRSKRVWGSLDFALFDGLSAALGLWMTNPLTALPVPDRLVTHPNDTIHLTERQKRILTLVEAGRSNTSIAQLLGYSVSTIKQELQRAMRATRANDRQEAARRARELLLLPGADDLGVKP